jgi:dTDP-4-amino-4,6-dideoxygalactose transaminase
MFPGGMRIGAEEEAAVLDVLRSKRLFRYYGPREGPSKVEEFERAVASHFGVAHALGVASGTSALACALAALGVGPGDEVIVPAYTWISSAAAVLLVGAVPVIADVDDALTLDPVSAEARITNSTVALMPVHMRGAPANMNALLDVAKRHGLRVVEDSAQAVGASYRGKRLGTLGDIGAFSLQFNKILTAGEGGLVTTDEVGLYERALMYHDVAGANRAHIAASESFVGTNCRMSELQGATLLVQLGRLERILSDMRAHFSAIKQRISGLAADKGVVWRRQWDAEGDACLALITYLSTPSEARDVVEALGAEGLPAQVLFDPDKRDLHVAYHWGPLVAGRSWAKQTPWTGRGAPTGVDVKSCQRTYDLLGRAVQVEVSPELTGTQVDQVCLALEKVFSSLPEA